MMMSSIFHTDAFTYSPYIFYAPQGSPCGPQCVSKNDNYHIFCAARFFDSMDFRMCECPCNFIDRHYFKNGSGYYGVCSHCKEKKCSNSVIDF